MQEGTVSHRHIKLLIIILMVGLSIRLLYAFGCEIIPDFSDQGQFNTLALRWIRGEGLIYDSNGTPSFDRVPLYPMFLGIIYFFAGESNYHAVYLVQSILSVVTIMSFYTIARQLFNPKTGLIAASLAAIYTPFVLYNITTFAESIILFLVALALALFVNMQSNIRRIIIVGCCFAIGCLCKPAVMFFLPGIIAVFLLRCQTIRNKLKAISLFLFVVILLLFPWTLRNFLLLDKFVLLSTGGQALYQGNHPNALKADGREVSAPLGTDPTDEDYNREGFSFFVNRLVCHPTQYFKLVFCRALQVLSPDRDSWMLDPLIIPSSQTNQRLHSYYYSFKTNQSLGEKSWPVQGMEEVEVLNNNGAKLILFLFPATVLLLGSFGCVLFFKLEHSFFVLPILSYLLVYVLFFFFAPRYRFLADLVFIIYTAAVLEFLISKRFTEIYKYRRLRLVCASITALFIITVWVRFFISWGWI